MHGRGMQRRHVVAFDLLVKSPDRPPDRRPAGVSGRSAGQPDDLNVLQGGKAAAGVRCGGDRPIRPSGSRRTGDATSGPRSDPDGGDARSPCCPTPQWPGGLPVRGQPRGARSDRHDTGLPGWRVRRERVQWELQEMVQNDGTMLLPCYSTTSTVMCAMVKGRYSFMAKVHCIPLPTKTKERHNDTSVETIARCRRGR